MKKGVMKKETLGPERMYKSNLENKMHFVIILLAQKKNTLPKNCLWDGLLLAVLLNGTIQHGVEGMVAGASEARTSVEAL